MKKTIITFFFLLTASFVFAGEKDATAIYREANLAYQKMDYLNAALMYEKLISEGHTSAEVYYNLGNSYFKSGNAPKAILNYERAKKLMPDDEDINFNLKIASLKVVDRIDVVPEVFYKRWLHSITSTISPNSWSTILIILIWVTFGFAAWYISGTEVATKRIAFIGLLVFAGISLGTYYFTNASYSAVVRDEQAVVMSSSVYVKSSPDEKGNDLFILHEGTKVEVLEPFEDWKKIRIANGTIGWLRAKDIEKI